MCFSLLEKLFLSNLDSFLTPPRHLAIYRVFQLLLIAILIASRQLGGSIDKISRPLIASQQPVDWSSFFIIFSVELFLNKSSTIASVEAFYAWHLSRHLSTPLSVWDLLNYYIFVQGDLFFILLDISLDLSVLSPPKSLSLTPNFFLKVSSNFFKIFFTW